MSPGTVRIGTRGSRLALWQASWVAERLRRELPEHRVELVTVTTRGDVREDALTGGPGEIGFFTSELETALIEERVDLAVHSLKDLPTAEAETLPVVAVPLRQDPADVLVSREYLALLELPPGARVGTSSPRRTCLVKAARTDLDIVPIRGNVDTRVEKVERGAYDAIVLAAAGLARLGLDRVVSERFSPSMFPPAPGQGALAVQMLTDEGALAEAVKRIDDAEARRSTTAERICLGELGGGCARPVGTYATTTGRRLVLRAFVGSPSGDRIVRAEATGDDPVELGRRVARKLMELGALELLS